jgi:hypothetical protein
MLDKKACKKMLVWDDDMLPEDQDKLELIVIETFDDGSCLAVDGPCEIDFLGRGAFKVSHWDNYEELPEKKIRPMTHPEIFAMMQHQMRRGNFVLFRHNNGYPTFSYWSMECNVCGFEYSTDLGKTWQKLEVEE